MSIPSKSAKAAAVLMLTSGVPDYETAVRLFDALEVYDGPLGDVFSGFPNACIWEGVENLDEPDWWAELTSLASTIDATRKHFKE